MKCAQCDKRLPEGKSRCPRCGKWHHTSESNHDGESLAKVQASDVNRIVSGPWDDAFSGGIVRDSVIMLSGSPGAGKSTLTLQIAAAVSTIELPYPVLYISKEESKGAVAARAARLGLDVSHVVIVSIFTGNTKDLLTSIRPSLTILDSLPALVGLGPGHLEEASEVLTSLKEYADYSKSPTIVIDHVTKEHDFAGEMALQHAVDGTFMLTVEKKTDARILGARKHRHGSVNVSVRFLMTEKGLIVPSSTESDKKTEDRVETSVYSTRRKTP